MILVDFVADFLFNKFVLELVMVHLLIHLRGGDFRFFFFFFFFFKGFIRIFIISCVLNKLDLFLDQLIRWVGICKEKHAY
jgi:hypothetical protein